ASVLRQGLRRVLIVDDDRTFQQILSRRLEPYCRDCLALADPRQALAAAAGGDFDCAILDLMMPELDGFALLSRLRDDEATERLPVLICSSRTPTAEEWALLQQLGAAFVPKSALEHESLGRGLIEAWRRAPGAAYVTAAGRAVGMH